MKKFEDSFSKFNFKVESHSDKGREEMISLLRQISKDKLLKEVDIFVLIIMSHGNSSHIYTADEDFISYNEVKLMFTNQKCPLLINKPKIIIFNCCRQPLTPGKFFKYF